MAAINTYEDEPQVPDQSTVKIQIDLNKSDIERMALLTDRLGIVHKDDIVRYCLSQVCWWVLSGPMGGSSLPSQQSRHVVVEEPVKTDTHRYGYQ